jgi:hypothetical protein
VLKEEIKAFALHSFNFKWIPKHVMTCFGIIHTNVTFKTKHVMTQFSKKMLTHVFVVLVVVVRQVHAVESGGVPGELAGDGALRSIL